MSCKIDPRKSQIVHQRAFLELVAKNKSGETIAQADASLLKTDKRFIWLHELIVVPECRDKGVGSELVDKLTEIGKMAKADLIYAYPASPAGEEKPIPQEKIENFYKNNGFKPCNAPKDVATITDEGLFKRGVCLILPKE